jgi:hypothetical protein
MFPSYDSCTPTAMLSAAVAASLPSIEQQKLSSCRPHSNCHSIYCPHCIQRAGFKRERALLQVATNLDQPLKFATLVGSDVPIGGLREASKVLMRSARTVCSRLKVKGSALRLEVSDPGSNDYHAHIHGLVSTPSGGKWRVSGADWQDAWLSELPAWLHPTVGGAHVKPVRSLGASCNYLLKSVFSSFTEGAYDGGDVQRTLDYIESCRGIQQFSFRGTLAAQISTL